MENEGLSAGPVTDPEPVAAAAATRDTPSQAVTRSATEIHYVTDDKGRRIGFRRLSILDRLRMFQIIGPDDVRNDAVMNLYIPAFYALSIDGDELPPVAKSPTAYRTINARVEMLGDEGIGAVLAGMIDKFGDEAFGAKDAKN